MSVDGPVAAKYGVLSEREVVQVQKGVLARMYGPYLKYDANAPEEMRWGAQIEAAIYLQDKKDEIPSLITADVDHCKELFDIRSYYYDQRKQ